MTSISNSQFEFAETHNLVPNMYQILFRWIPFSVSCRVLEIVAIVCSSLSRNHDVFTYVNLSCDQFPVGIFFIDSELHILTS